MTDEKPKTSILVCTLKKSVSVTKHIAKPVIGLLLCCVLVLVASWYWDQIFPVITVVFTQLWEITKNIMFQMVAVPFWVWGIVLAVFGIVGYSYAWCVAREITEEEWSAAKKEDVVVFLLLVTLFNSVVVLCTVALRYCGEGSLVPDVGSAVVLFLCMYLLEVGVVSVLLLLTITGSVTNLSAARIFDFPYAYYLYCKRSQNNK